MKKNLLIIGALAVVSISTSAFVILKQTGIAGMTGSPGESTCTGCHTPGSAVATTSISGSPAFTGNQYVPGQTYSINITVSSPTLAAFGFGCEVLDGTTAGATNAGVMSGISVSSFSQIKVSGTRNNAVHITTALGLGGSKTFKFLWVAPSSGPAVIYAAGVAANNNGNDGAGDAVGTASLVLSAGPVGVLNLEKNVATLNAYPNPSEDNLTLQYSLINEGNVKATLYNLQGKEVCVLFNSHQNAGSHTKTVIYPNEVSKGVYLVKLFSNGTELVQKMIIKQ